MSRETLLAFGLVAALAGLVAARAGLARKYWDQGLVRTSLRCSWPVVLSKPSVGSLTPKTDWTALALNFCDDSDLPLLAFPSSPGLGTPKFGQGLPALCLDAGLCQPLCRTSDAVWRCESTNLTPCRATPRLVNSKAPVICVASVRGGLSSEPRCSRYALILCLS